MPLIQVRMPAPTEPAEHVVADMLKLLDRRRSLRIGRKAFLVQWGALRRRLEATEEYQTFRWEVWKRDHGSCVGCGRSTHTVHHKRRVARAPKMALLASNGELRCFDCHKKLPGHARWLRE